FLRFLREGGYTDRALWSEADWEWRTTSGISHPVFWVQNGDAWSYRTMFDQIPLPPDWPVYVSHAEASAYAKWAGKELPTEAEWQRAASGVQGNDEPGGRWNPVSVNECTMGNSSFGIDGM